ncbi:unnamed protein product [Eruca vesicaria subsp. sativa]|uniref:Uncharacterized protein n=1 Tax=Eruca vesicaria subsp. sativa TaxID=29727 RepID=A0ABC8KLT0_ERUVS|nr:unnamed protein product [Eruca vesicaria subsp. sativa]
MGFARSARMTILFLLIIFYLSPSSAVDIPVASDSGRRSNVDVGFIFQTWLSTHGKSYVNALGEKQRRFEIFKDNLRFVDQHNAKNLSYQLGLNRFADLTVKEYQGLLAGGFDHEPTQRARRVSHRYVSLAEDQLPESVDWRKEGAVTAVKDQGSCSCCWAFSTVAAVEGINKIVTGELISLSEQELLDCNIDNYGCAGRGYMDISFKFLINNNIGLVSQIDYPYTAVQGNCNHNENSANKVVKIDGYEDLPVNDEMSLKKAVAHQPVSVGIDKKSREFMLYKSGIYNGPCGTQLDHAVVIVGYGSENGQDYWIVKNSWGTIWGEAGFVKMARNTQDPAGICGITMIASYPIKK